jgi:uncharacterized membrane protein
VTSSLALALGSMVLAGVADFLYKRAQLAGVRATTFLWVQSATFNVCNLATALATDSLRPEPLLLVFGLFGWFQKLGTVAGVPPAALLVGQGLVYLSLAVPGSLLTGSLRPNRAELAHGPICGVLLSISFLTLLMSLRTGEASVNVPINQLGFVLSAVLAALFLGERLGRRKILGLLAAALAVAVFAV